MATKKFPFEKSKKDVEKARFGKEGSKKEERMDTLQKNFACGGVVGKKKK